MHITPNDADWALATEVHESFARKSGARHIASPFALAHLSAVLNSERPVSVLEFGAGIGTTTYLLLSHPSRIARVTATEDNQFCIEEFAKNIGDQFKERYELVTKVKGLAVNSSHYDLVVIDGLLEPDQYKLITLGTTCFVEGSRRPTRRELNEQLASRRLNCPFVNYNRGTRYFHLSMHHDPETGRRRPKFKFRNVLKGCWIGKVVASG